MPNIYTEFFDYFFIEFKNRLVYNILKSVSFKKYALLVLKQS